MLISEQKPLEEILNYLDGEKNIFLIGCIVTPFPVGQCNNPDRLARLFERYAQE